VYRNPAPERGDIYHIDVVKSEIVGHELYGPHWWVVLSIVQLNKALGIFTGVPLTSPINKSGGEQKDHDDFRHFRIRVLNRHKIPDPGQSAKVLEGDSIALPESIRHLSIERITAPRVGVIDKDGLAAIEAGLLFVNGAGLQRKPLDLTLPEKQPQPAFAGPREEPKPIPGKPRTR